MISIIEKHYIYNRDKLVKKFSHRAGSTAAAEDIIQDAYERAIRYKDTFWLGENFNAWFGRIANNALKDYKRAERGGLHVELDEALFIEDFNEDVENTIFNRQIEERIKGKQDKMQEVLSLYFVYGYGSKTIHAITGHPYEAVRKAVERFRKELRE